MLDFVRNLIGTVDPQFDFILVIGAVILLLVIVVLILNFFLSFFTCLTNRFFRS